MLDAIAEPVKLPAHAIVYTEQEKAHSVFIICKGQLKVSTMSREGRIMIVKLAVAGDILELSAVLNKVPHEVTAETLEPTLLKRIRNTDFVNFLDTYREVGGKTSMVIAREYREVFLDARRLALSGSAAGKLARLLLDWAQGSSCGADGLEFTMALIHEDLASLAGISRDTVTRLLNQFEREDLILRQGKSLRILQQAKLSELSE